jgi:hypothetical protein
MRLENGPLSKNEPLLINMEGSPVRMPLPTLQLEMNSRWKLIRGEINNLCQSARQYRLDYGLPPRRPTNCLLIRMYTTVGYTMGNRLSRESQIDNQDF